MESFSIPLYFLTSFYRSITADAMPMPVYSCFVSLQLHAHAQLVTYEVEISEIDGSRPLNALIPNSLVDTLSVRVTIGSMLASPLSWLFLDIIKLIIFRLNPKFGSAHDVVCLKYLSGSIMQMSHSSIIV
jgi:hypothetical protein